MHSRGWKIQMKFLDKIPNVHGKIAPLFEIYKIWLIIGNTTATQTIKTKNTY